MSFVNNKGTASHHILVATVLCCFLFFINVLLPSSRILAAESSPSLSSNNQEPTTTDSRYQITGYFSARYVYRTAALADGGHESDQDLFGQLRLDVTMPKENRYEFHFFGTAAADLDGNRNSRYYNPLETILDTYNRSYAGYLYEAHLDINSPLSSVTQLRLGRQGGTRDEGILFDGLAADLTLARNLHMTAYGGAAVYLYQIDYDWGSDVLGGAGIDYTPTRSTVLSLDYLFVKDEQNLYGTATLRDELISLKLWQSFSDFLKGTAKYRYINGDPRDLTVRLVQTLPAVDFEWYANYFRQFRIQRRQTTDLSLYYDVMGPSYPYQSIDVKVRKLFGTRYAVDLGYFHRVLLEGWGQTDFNRDYTRYYAVFELSNLLSEGLSLSLTGEYWDSNGQSFSSAGADATYVFKKAGKSAKISVGTYYSLYKYDYAIELNEKTNVRTYYLNGAIPLGNGFSVNAGYEYEDSLEDFQTVKLGMRYDF